MSGKNTPALTFNPFADPKAMLASKNEG